MNKETQTRIENFLAALLSNIRAPKIKEQIRQEIGSHIHDTLEHLMESGLSEEAALEKALSRLGDPEILGRKLSIANRPWYLRWIFLAPASAVAIAILGIVTLHVLVQHSVADLKSSFYKDSHFLDLYLKDQQYLAKFEFLNPPSRKRDAGEFLNSRSGWEGRLAPEEYRHSKLGLTPLVKAELMEPFLPQKGEAIKLMGKRWLEMTERKLFGQIDLSWMRQLEKYDHWDIFTFDSPARKSLEMDMNPIATPAPNYSDFQILAKIRLLRGLYEKRPLPALKEVRNLALLIHSNETVISSMVAISILRTERMFYQEAVRRKLLRPEDWQVISENDQEILRRASYATAEWFSLFTPDEFRRKVMELRKPAIGICGALYESAFYMAAAKTYFKPRIWGEIDFRENFSSIEALIHENKQRCRLTAVDLILNSAFKSSPETVGYYTDIGIGGHLGFMVYRYARHVPFLRRYLGAQFLYVMKPGFINLYRRALASEGKQN